jgi:hypothetical protein
LHALLSLTPHPFALSPWVFGFKTAVPTSSR